MIRTYLSLCNDRCCLKRPRAGCFNAAHWMHSQRLHQILVTRFRCDGMADEREMMRSDESLSELETVPWQCRNMAPSVCTVVAVEDIRNQ